MIIPVIDIKDGIAVSAKAGNRDEYMPLKSTIVDSSDPVDVAKAYKKIGFTEFYIADLDGILHAKPNIDLLEEMSGMGRLMVDIGIRSKDDLEILNGINGINAITPIIGTETMQSPDLLENNCILSIDTKNGELLSRTGITIRELIDLIKNGVYEHERIIILDLKRAGMGLGPNFELCDLLARKLTGMKLIYGCGIRGAEDIMALNRANIPDVLVGSMIHSKSLPNDSELLFTL